MLKNTSKMGLLTMAMAAALLLFFPHKADARVRFGITFGAPVYSYPAAPYAYSYSDPYYQDYNYASPYSYPAPTYVAPYSYGYSYGWGNRDRDRHEWREREHERFENRGREFREREFREHRR